MDGFDELEKLLSEYEEKVKNPIKILEVGAKELATDLRRLPKPRSRMRGTGYTHLLDTVSHKTVNEEVEVGWGKYYGPMVERGTRKMRGVAHMKPTFERNEKKYYEKMTEELFK